MFKINHWKGATTMLVVGLSTEAVIFFFSAFEPPHEEVDWSLVYPELAGMHGEEGEETKELEEDNTLNVTQDPDATDDGMGIFEKENESGPNPFAICHAQVGPKKSRKWDRCVMSVKKQLKEGKNPVSLFLESQIEKIVEKHLPPRITKGDLLKVISETSTTAPVKEPITKPTTKPRIRPAHPGKNPHPGEKEAPRAKKSETKESTTAPVKEPILILSLWSPMKIAFRSRSVLSLPAYNITAEPPRIYNCRPFSVSILICGAP
jgi:hypothetical protein